MRSRRSTFVAATTRALLRSSLPPPTRVKVPYLKKEVPKDPWDRPYYYRSPGEAGRPYDLYSLGADGTPGGEGDGRDITSWEGDTG